MLFFNNRHIFFNTSVNIALQASELFTDPTPEQLAIALFLKEIIFVSKSNLSPGIIFF